MALPSSGAISLNEMHVEVEGTSGTTCSINDSDIRSLIDKADGATSSFNEFYGAAFITYMSASGGTESTSGNYKFHKFTSSGTFTVNTVASGGASAVVDYVIVHCNERYLSYLYCCRFYIDHPHRCLHQLK